VVEGDVVNLDQDLVLRWRYQNLASGSTGLVRTARTGYLWFRAWPGTSLLGSVRSMRDRDVRTALASTIAARLRNNDYVLFPEVAIRWSNPARIEALLVNDRISGFEIESDADFLTRLREMRYLRFVTSEDRTALTSW
jgi:hypothetical protein